MKTTHKLATAFSLLATTFFAFAQVTDQPNQPSSPQDRVAVADEVNANSDDQPVTLKVNGANLRDSVGSPVGRVENLIINPNSGQVEFLIVAPYFPTNSTKVMAVPWKAISYRSDQSGMGSVPGGNQVFALAFPRTKLQQAPSFERYRWPDMTQEKWRQTIYSFYSTPGEAAGATPTQSFAGSGTGSGGPPSRLNRSASDSSASYSNEFIGPRIQSAPAIPIPTNSAINPADGRRGSSTPDNRLPVGARFGR